MTAHVVPVFQAAVEYGATNSTGGSAVAEFARTATNTAQDAWRVVSEDPVLLIGLIVVAVLAFLLLRSP